MMAIKFLTALAWIAGPLCTWLMFGAFAVAKSDRDRSWAQVTIFMMTCALLADAWLLAKYLL